MRVQRRARRLPSFTLGLVLIAQHAPNAIARPTSLLPRGLLPIAASVALYTPFASAQQVPQGSVGKGTADTSEPCSWSNACPSNAPCCSEFGACGAGVSCLGGCNPQFSANSSYCAPLPVCQSSNYTFTDTSRIQMKLADWDGDASKYDWVVDKLDGSNPELIQNGELVLTLTESGGGTRLSSTREVLYGTITASIKTVGAPGVVTAFITMSGAKDEIDAEWTGTDTDEVQNNYYWQGDVDNYSHGGKAVAANRHEQYHTYGFIWTAQQLSFTVDGKTVRTVKASDTVDGGLTKFPQTPSRVQMSVWPAGIPGTAQGTLDWAGGLIDWKSAEYQANGGAYKAHIQWIDIQCDDGSGLSMIGGGGNSTSSKMTKRDKLDNDEDSWKRWLAERAPFSSYVYGTNNSAGQIQVGGSTRDTIINSPYSTGLNMVIKGRDTKGVTKGGLNGSSDIPTTAVGKWWANLGTPAKVGIVIGAVAALLFTIVVFCTCWARRKDNRKKKYAQVNDTAAIPLTAAGAAAGGKRGGPAAAAGAARPGRLAPQVSSGSLASSIGSKQNQQAYYAGAGDGGYSDPDNPQKGGGGGGGGGMRNEWTQQDGWSRGRQHHHIPREQPFHPQQYQPQLSYNAGYAHSPAPYDGSYAQQPHWPGEGDVGKQGWQSYGGAGGGGRR